MKILYSWLSDFIAAPLAPEELQAKLGRIGLKTESISKTGAAFEGVTVGRILKIEKHPNADKLSLCDVDSGSGVTRVVCGAKNIAEGQKILFARVGAKLAGGELKKAKIRGVESEGMICSAPELGLPGDGSASLNNSFAGPRPFEAPVKNAGAKEDGSGILVLPENSPVGADAKTLFEKPDLLLEIEMLPNLAYCLSHYAVARELCAFYNLPLKKPVMPELTPPPASGPKGPDKVGQAGGGVKTPAPAPVTIEEPGLCARYSGIVIKNIPPVPTPPQMAARLAAMGSKAKGNLLIDVSNYVMYELGQPVHCFDLNKLSGPEVKVRRAKPGETLKTIDGKTLKLDEDMLVIADREKPAALAGVMGGADSAVSDATTAILIESAWFEPSAVRRASKKAGIKSESSYRFERGVDPELQLCAALRVAQLILAEVPGASLEQISDVNPVKYVPAAVEADPARINAILGTEIPEQDIFACLKAISPSIKDEKPWTFYPPSYRRDIESAWDLAEEVARYSGYDVIPVRSSMKMMSASVTPAFEAAGELRARLSALGFSEVYNYDFISLKELQNCLLNEAAAISLKNPLSSDFQFLRPSLVTGLLKALDYNINRGRNSAAIFETGTVYSKSGAQGKEEICCSGLMFGSFPAELFWKGGADSADLYHLKGVMDYAFSGKSGFRFEKPKSAPAYFQPGAVLEMKLGAGTAGFLGLLNSTAVVNSGLKDVKIYYFEILLSALARSRKADFWQRVSQVKPVSAYPAIWRDLSVVLEDKYEWAELEREVVKTQDLARVELIDVYKGKNIDGNLRSVTIRFTFSSMEKTLTDSEINGHMAAILEKLSKKFSAKLRS
ncbi:MAG: phenylalanine--tRNA ligase subunit beta [Elusimicrobia bacterium GWC2_51_8]|nr:MAG: phenylalanine--tRNA ligase subunit beta [Elusimicrobia bacterium GWA2_51_34]OGR61754.1 MAG: phenylalanine--tRNA ligase subunit beta [Elusimicrobia bacterium GWC2_51_8]HAF96036.1 phenylalanine--tRNA ligase subunit beta [Elusimicrobiota bacterium]HCE98645.1 phenylalanine--tRNA ligase subunit beta [Elusimicrobiota bacterium]